MVDQRDVDYEHAPLMKSGEADGEVRDKPKVEPFRDKRTSLG
ncbi:hypothetical protein ID866_1223 [Astraeus odoratus]|nr:hypothetical protein ID866_1223 [Astraeus odoratus]